MNDLLFYTLLIALIYYFFFYRPQKKLNANLPLKPNKETQTETIPTETTTKEIERLKKDIEQKERTIIGLNNSYEKLATKKNQQIQDLQAQIRELVKRPLKPTNSKSTQTDDKVLTQTLDTLIKDIQTLNNSL